MIDIISNTIIMIGNAHLQIFVGALCVMAYVVCNRCVDTIARVIARYDELIPLAFDIADVVRYVDKDLRRDRALHVKAKYANDIVAHERLQYVKLLPEHIKIRTTAKLLWVLVIGAMFGASFSTMPIIALIGLPALTVIAILSMFLQVKRYTKILVKASNAFAKLNEIAQTK